VRAAGGKCVSELQARACEARLHSCEPADVLWPYTQTHLHTAHSASWLSPAASPTLDVSARLLWTPAMQHDATATQPHVQRLLLRLARGAQALAACVCTLMLHRPPPQHRTCTPQLQPQHLFSPRHPQQLWQHAACRVPAQAAAGSAAQQQLVVAESLQWTRRGGRVVGAAQEVRAQDSSLVNSASLPSCSPARADLPAGVPPPPLPSSTSLAARQPRSPQH
jgi:hypothetical protein